MKTIIVIPARMASTRLPRKPLCDILGTSLIMHVFRRCKMSKLANDVIVATDDEEIVRHVEQHGGKALMTNISHQSGTDRVAEVMEMSDGDLYINVQGDEPLIDPRQIDDLIHSLTLSDVGVATQCERIEDADSLFDYNIVKVVRDQADKAMYFSRQAIPAVRDKPYREWIDASSFFRHVGIYGFRREVLFKIAKLSPSGYEKAESLEQLRWLEAGIPILCRETSYFSIGVDTPDDLDKVIQLMLKEMNS
jgi:3-deoxy-manno-octulosonate cytidylyltransferase (CMP-KDO synthetase)